MSKWHRLCPQCLCSNFNQTDWSTSPWRGIRDLLDLLPGPILEENQKVPGYNVKNNKKDRQTTLVLFIGGCTFAEISALRFLSEQEDSNVDYLVATTSIINGDKFIKGLMTDVVDCLQF